MREATRARARSRQRNPYLREACLCVSAALLTEMEFTTAWSSRQWAGCDNGPRGQPAPGDRRFGMPGGVLLPDTSKRPASAQPASPGLGKAADSSAPGQQGRRHRAQLHRARQGVAEPGSTRATAFLEAAFVAAGLRRGHHQAQTDQPARPRSRVGRGDRAHLPQAAVRKPMFAITFSATPASTM